MKQIGRKLTGLIYAWIFIAFALSVNTAMVFADEPDTNWRTKGIIDKPVTLTQDEEITLPENGEFIIANTLKLNGHKMTVNGNVELTAHLYLTNGTMTVTGNFTHGNESGAGELYFEGGTLVIGGNYTLRTPGTNGHGALVMNSDKDTMKVGGDFTTISTSGYNKFEAGTLYIGGDFRQLGSSAHISPSNTSTHRTVFNGIGNQVILFEVDGSNTNYFNTIEVCEGYTGKIYIPNTLNFRKLGSDMSVICGEPQSATASGDAQESSLAEENVCYINKNGASCDFNGKTLQIKGDVSFMNTIDLNGGTLDIDGSLYETDKYSSPKLNINKGTLKVTGNYDLLGNSTLIMNNEKDTIYIDGSFTTTSSSGYNDFSAGTIYLGGDFTQKGENSHINPSQSEAKSSTHKVLLNGKGKQTIRFEAAGTGSSNYFNEIGVVEGYSGEAHISRSFNFRRLATDMTVISDALGEDETLSDDASCAFINYCGANPGDLNGHTLHVIGDISFANRLDLNSGNLIVDGNFFEVVSNSRPTLVINKGTLTVNGDCAIIGAVCLEMENSEDTIRVSGNFTTDSSNILKAGALYVGGDFTQTGTSSFAFNQDCSIIFNGKKLQTITIDSNSSSHFYNVGLTQNKETGYKFPEQETFMQGKFYCAEHSGGTATCKNKAVCVVFGEEYGELDSNNHVGGTEIRNAKAASYTEKGYTGDTYCKGCGAKLATGSELAMLQKPEEPKPEEPKQEDKGATLTDTDTNAKVEVTNPGKIVDGKVVGAEVTYTKPAEAKSTVNIPKTITIGNVEYAVTSIDKNAFKGDKKVTTVTIGENVKTIDQSAFANCKKLSKVTIGKNVKTIGKDAFSGNKKLKTITMKSTKVPTIGKNAFKGLPKNATIKVPKKLYKDFKKKLTSKTGFNSKTMKLKKV